MFRKVPLSIRLKDLRTSLSYLLLDEATEPLFKCLLERLVEMVREEYPSLMGGRDKLLGLGTACRAAVTLLILVAWLRVDFY